MKIHIEIGSFQFIEEDVESVEEAHEVYHSVKKMFSACDGLDDKTWREVLDRYLTEKTMNADDYASMSEKQQAFIQECKRSFKRTEK